MPNDHPHEFIPAYVLGALDADEAQRVRAHLAVCHACRAEVASFQAAISISPHTVPGQDPPQRVKRQLMARVAAGSELQPEPAQPTPPPRPCLPPSRLASVVAACAVVLSFALGYVAADSRMRAEALAAQLAESRREVAALQARLGEDEQFVAFIASPQTVSQILPPTGRAGAASAQMYMQPGHTGVALVVRGLPQPPPGKVYRLWLASETERVALGAFTAGAGDLAQFHAHAPRPMDTYAQVMVTLEEGHARSPSGEVLFEIDL